MKTIKIDNKTARGLTITVGMPDEEYRAIPALSAHGTHDLLTKPMHWARGGQEDTEAMKFGRAFHFMVLECCSGTVFDENKFFEKFAVAPEVNARTKDGKAALEEFKAECEKNGKEALKSQDFDLLNAMRTRVFASKSAITGLGKNDENTLYEAVLEWDYVKGDGTLVNCKGKADALIIDEKLGLVQIADLKTTLCADEASFARSAINYGYGWQAAFYSSAFANTGLETSFYIVAVEKTLIADLGFWDMQDFVEVETPNLFFALEHIDEIKEKAIAMREYKAYNDLPIAVPAWYKGTRVIF